MLPSLCLDVKNAAADTSTVTFNEIVDMFDFSSGARHAYCYTHDTAFALALEMDKSSTAGCGREDIGNLNFLVVCKTGYNETNKTEEQKKKIAYNVIMFAHGLVDVLLLFWKNIDWKKSWTAEWCTFHALFHMIGLIFNPSIFGLSYDMVKLHNEKAKNELKETEKIWATRVDTNPFLRTLKENLFVAALGPFHPKVFLRMNLKDLVKDDYLIPVKTLTGDQFKVDGIKMDGYYSLLNLRIPYFEYKSVGVNDMMEED